MIVAVAFLLLLSGPLALLNVGVDAEDDTRKVLFDMGNGDTQWYDASSGDTYGDVLKNTATHNGISYVDDTDLIINGKGLVTIGSTVTGGDLVTSGTTGVHFDTSWKIFKWDQTSEEWVEVVDLTDNGGEHLAAGYYPNGVKPVETPEYQSSWTMIRGDAEQTGHQDSVSIASHDAQVDWSFARGGTSGVYSSVLYVEDHVFVKFGASRGVSAALIAYKLDGSNDTATMQQWIYEYQGQQSYETSTPTIIGEYIYLQSGYGHIYKIPWREGPGDGNINVVISEKIPETTGASLKGDSYGTGIGSLVYDSGALYLTSHNGMIYCFDLDLELIWSRQMTGYTYYTSPTISGDYLFTGARDGHLYIVDKTDGSVVADVEVYYQSTTSERKYGNVSVPVVFRNDDTYTVMFSISDGRGMNSVVGGIGVYKFDASTSTITKISVNTGDYGLTSNYILPVSNSDFTGIYVAASKGIFKVDTNGTYKLLNDDLNSIKAPLTLVNGSSIYFASYSSGKPIYEMDLDGDLISLWAPSTSVRNYCMAPVVFVNGALFYANDSGVVATSGSLPEYVAPAGDDGLSALQKIVIFVAILFVILFLIYIILRFVKGIDKPFSYIGHRFSEYLGSEDLKHNTRSRHRLLVVMIVGITITVIVFMVCLCVGPTSTMGVGEMLSSLVSAISKGGENLTYNELMVYESRLPRTIAALAVGIGLSVAGSMYQAIIRNPLVDPYIMGVSAGAGTAAVAVIAFDFTFFGLFAAHSIYLTAFTAMIGGVIAFFATMFIAEKAGGSSLNYVLAGVVIGLAFSAIQTLMLSMAGQKVSNALSWLFGSFANVGWSEIALIVFPAIALSLVPLIWAKEFNLVLLGEDQAQQMGLNVRRFNRTMLILASVLTSVCVAFVGIIGFVGLVIPHLCRMILGGDHRLVLPASIALGGALMMIADLAARMIYYGQELPVGAITTLIGVPVFAYLLIKRGRMYDG